MISAEQRGKYIRSKREALGMTQVQLSRILGTSYQNISKWETGTGSPTTDMLNDLAKALKCDIESIVRGRDMDKENEIELMEYGRIYLKEKNLANKVLFNRCGLSQVLYKDQIYDYGENGWEPMYWALFELATCEDPFMYKETLSYEAVNIMPSSDPSDFVPLSELVVKEIKDGDKQDNAITIGDQRIYLSNTLKKYVQSIIMGLRDEVYYSICDLSVEQLRKLDETYLMYEDNYWYRFMNVVDIYDIQQKFTDEYLQIIANDIITQRQNARM